MKGLTIDFAPPKTLIVKIQGAFNPEMVTAYFNRLVELKDSADIDKPNAVFDLSELGEIPPQTREILRKRGAKYPMGHVALVGASTKIRIMSGLILKMIPTVEHSKFFDTKEEAISWMDDHNSEG